ncbi:MAG: PDZ domain-containing protein [Firmicutes bacterium]|nr:PDZ domain-containing protein [Bacillota bacterium]
MGKSTVKLVAILIALALIITSFSFVFFLPAAYGATNTYAEQAKQKEDSMTDEEKADVLLNRLNFLYQYINYVDQNYKDEVEINDLIDGAFNGVTNALGDQFSEYFLTQESADAFTTYVENTFVGIGVRITTTADGGSEITGLIEGGPAEKIGIKAGDRIAAVDGEDATHWDSTVSSQHLRGEKGTTVKVTVIRDGQKLDFTIKRDTVSDASVSYSMLEDSDIGYIYINKFDVDTATEFKTDYEQLLALGAKAFLLDLRENGGGYTNQAEKIADYIMEGVTIDQYEQQGVVYQTNKANDGHKISEPMVVLVNGNTASSAELLAGALQQGGYKLVGDKTYGKGFSQVMQSLVDGHSFKLSTSYFLVGNGVKITTEGLTPDYLVTSGTLSAEEREAFAAAAENFASFPLTEKPAKGASGLTVYAAQQRLGALGYDTSYNSMMDDKTVAAVKAFQKDYGLYAYGTLDLTTQKTLDTAVKTAASGLDNAEAQEEKALEVLKGLRK